MANTANTCSHLKIDDKFYRTLGIDVRMNIVKYLIETQKEAQLNDYELDFSTFGNNELEKYLVINYQSLNDELNEFIDALGGIKDGGGSTVWKYWKQKYNDYHNLKIEDLSEEDRLELEFELIDICKFLVLFPVIYFSKPYDMEYLYKEYEYIFRKNTEYLDMVRTFQHRTYYENKSLHEICMEVIKIKFNMCKHFDTLTQLNNDKEVKYIIFVEMFDDFINLCEMVNVDSEILVNLFNAKQIENKNRQLSSY